ncbi:hypothetical protein BEWA_054750 [Theileria equi strain WA]|uniref:Uncharacterized protein n=1 Tax=Theileria equi strain WA TaxID=1537102 RepID=L1LE36_THEEQ|nr:hypothetical protein BEWA_054750 [Theileria equi strain WA]EKX73418.1 hypothetical protein BEWA_054750 [Theileria equi strain WA]|eukprot:XP_004832870.1 hypothetical protein BEWA_054750 [Theileria equi strain WA]
MIISPVVNVHNRCNRVCRCKGGRHLTAKAGTLGNTDFRFCTHEAIGTSKISNVTWQGIEIEKIGGLAKALHGTKSVTTYYHRAYDGQQASIKRPLLIRVKDITGKRHWFENLGHYANKKWQRIDGEALSGGYPDNDTYSNISDLEKKLNALTCRLFMSHYIRIDSDKNDNRECPICKQHIDVKFQQDSPGISGYARYNYEEFLENSILVHNNVPLTYRRKTTLGIGYYLPIPVDKGNFGKISVYYWKEDSQKKNPLLIEFVGNFGFSYWIENISRPGKDGNYQHDKWRPIGMQGTGKFDISGHDLKTRLDILNCIYNRVLQIYIGNQKDCHHPKHFLHKNRVSCGYSEVFGTYPVLYSYRYRPTLSYGEPFNVSEVKIEGNKQELVSGVLPFMNVTSFIVYVSPCDKDKPFLICVETGNSTGYREQKNYKWYKTEEINGLWKEHSFSATTEQSPNKVIDKLKDVLEKSRSPLQIKPCHIETKQEGIQFDIEQNPREGEYFCNYYGQSGSRRVPIFVTKSRDTPVVNFFKNSQKPAMKNDRTFVVQRQLVGGSEFQSKVVDVKIFDVYFWEGDTNRPIIIEVKKNGEQNTRYYGKGNGHSDSWLYGSNEGRSLLESLDHWNCENNNAIPIDLTNPTDLKRFYDKKTSKCLQSILVTESNAYNLPTEAKSVYEAKTYQLESSKRVSRLTYNGNATNIVPPYTEYGPTLNIYFWSKESKMPLLVEFKPKAGGSDWFENLGGDGTKWKRIDEIVTKEFYDPNDPSRLTYEFTEKLNEVNCRIHGVTQIDISKKAKEPYCHTSLYAHEKRIKITPLNNPELPYYNIYEHSPATTGKNTLKISSIYNGNDKQNISKVGLLTDVKKVIVYYPECDGGVPIVIHIQFNGGSGKWFKRESEKGQWKEDTNEFESKNTEQIKEILDIITKSTSACGHKIRVSLAQEPRLPTSPNDPDDNLKFTEVFKDFGNLDDEQNNTSDFVGLYDEYEDPGIVKEQNKVTFVTIPSGTSRMNNFFTPGFLTALPLETAMSGVIIDIKEKPNVGNSKAYKISSSSGKDVELYKIEEPDRSRFHMFIHTSSDDIPFNVGKVVFGEENKHIADLKSSGDRPVDSYSVWYWTGDQEMNNPLLIEISNSDGKYIYNFSKDNWESWSGAQEKNKLEGEPLENVLDDQNCSLNKAVTIDLSKKVSENNVQGSGYCCSKCNNKKVTVKYTQKRINTVNMEYYVHAISDRQVKLSKIKYYENSDNNSPRKRITSYGLRFPIEGPVDVYVYYCNGTPALIYVKKDGSDKENKWFKREGNSNSWIEVPGNFGSTTPEDIGNNPKCDSWRKVDKVLQDLGCKSQTCADTRVGKSTSGVSTTISVALPTTAAQSLPQTQDSQLSIQLSENKRATENPPEYKDTISNKGITVTRSFCPTSQGSTANFFKYTHKDSSGNKEFTLKEIKDDGWNVITTEFSGKKVTAVSAYYWKHENGSGQTPTKVLLVEVLSEKDPKCSYYARRSGSWISHKIKNPEKGPTQAELELLNCEINDVVQIDVAQITDYCHDSKDIMDKHDNKKVSVKEVGDGQLGSYSAYEHIPNEAAYTRSTPHKFNISAFKKENKHIPLKTLQHQLPVRNAIRVVVYFCGKIPLLFYIDSSTLNGKDKWFQSTTQGMSWDTVGPGAPENEREYDRIIGILDSLQSYCKPPEVTIDIYERSISKPEHAYKDESTNNIDVKPEGMSEISRFSEYKHTVQNRNYFTIRNINCNGQLTAGIVNITVAKPLKYVSSVLVYYWTPLESRPKDHIDQIGRPLLVKITTQGPDSQSTTEKYYENKGFLDNTKWEEWRPNPPTKVILEKKLRLLNCRLNNAVIIDVSQKDNPGYYDACETTNKDTLDPSHGDTKMQVKKEDEESLKGYEVYIHKLKDGLSGQKFHVVKFLGSSKEILTGLPKNILDVEEVRVYICPDDPNKPLLIYYKTDRGHIWYKNTYQGSTLPGKWESAGNALSTGDDTQQYEEILQILSTLKSSYSVAKESKTQAFSDGGATIVTGATLGIGAISGISSGTLTGAGGLTGFGLWMFKRYNGDPWVRQI